MTNDHEILDQDVENFKGLCFGETEVMLLP